VGRTYEISAWLAASSDSDTIARIAVFNPATGETTFSPEWKPTPNWQQVKYSVRLEKGNTLKIHLWKQSGKAAVYWDDVQFEAAR
jgi:hypothetical protein